MNKDRKAYKSIGEVAKDLSIKAHTLRFWEKEFKQIKPKILTGNRRYYDKNTIDLLKKVKFLLKDHGMTINGVKKFLTENKSIKLDEMSNESISTNNLKLKNKIKKILKIKKEIKKLK